MFILFPFLSPSLLFWEIWTLIKDDFGIYFDLFHLFSSFYMNIDKRWPCDLFGLFRSFFAWNESFTGVNMILAWKTQLVNMKRNKSHELEMSIWLRLDLKQRKPNLCGSPFSFQLLHFGETENLYAYTHFGFKIFYRFEYFLVSTESEFLIFLNVPWCSQTPFWFPTLFLLSCLP